MKTQEKVYIAVAVLVVVGFLLAVRVMKGQLRAERREFTALRDTGPRRPRSVEVRIECKSNFPASVYSAIRPRMTFQEVSKILQLKRLDTNVEGYFNKPGFRGFTVIFESPDGSTIEVLFRRGTVISKRRVGGPMNRLSGAPAQ